MRPGKRDRNDRRPPIGVTGIFLVFDGNERAERFGHAIIQLRSETRHVAKIAVNETVVLGAADVKAIIETTCWRAAAGTEVRTKRTE